MKATIIITAAIVFAACCLRGAATAAAPTAPSSTSSFTVYGTWSALQAISAIVGRYENDRQSHGVNFMPVSSEQIMGMLARHQCDVGIPFDSFAAKPGEKTTGKYERFPLGRFVIAVAVNERNPLRAISLGDLQTAFALNLMTGPRSWKDITGSGSSMQIEAYRPDKFCPEGWFFQRRVLFGGPFADELSAASIAQHKKKSDAQIIAAVAEQANAIGFIRYPFDKIKEKRIRILGIAKEKRSSRIYPSPATLADPAVDYPLADTLTLYLHPNAPAEARKFCKFASGAEAAKIIKQCGLWPEYELDEVRGVKRLNDVKAHRGAEIIISGSPAWQGLMKDLGVEFSKAKTAVEIKYHAVSPDAAVGEFVGGGEPASPLPPSPHPLPLFRVRARGEGRKC